MKKKLLLILTSLSIFAIGNVIAEQYTELTINFSPSKTYHLQIASGPHTRVNEAKKFLVEVSNHNFDHRAQSTLSVVNNHGGVICRYGVSLMSGKDALQRAKKYHNVLHEQININNECLACGDNGGCSSGTVSTGANFDGDSHIDVEV